MDVKKTIPPATRWWQKKQSQGIAVVVILLSGLLAWRGSEAGIVTVQRSDILIEAVQRGDLEVVIEGYGNLVSNKQQLITSLTAATVKEILLKPGAIVSADSVIVRLENLELQQLLDSAEQQLVQARANLRQLKLTQQREVLDESDKKAQISAGYDNALLKRQAEEDLVKQGIVSRLTFQASVLNEKLFTKRLAIIKQRMAQLKLVHLEAVNIEQEKIKQQQGRLNIAESRLARLEVKAGFDGVLQRLSVELGQGLTAGQEIALIGSATDLVAQIKIGQNQVQNISLGQSALIDTRQDKINGKVVRIDPIVTDNTVTVEIALSGVLPASARPQLSVDGTIIADKLNQVMYMQRPANIKANSQVQLYRLADDLDSAQLQLVQFGRKSGRFIEILSGASAHQQFIISDLSHLVSTNSQLNISL
jgi:HlyD family secretion protein